ncbi:hypothetical protein BSP109_02648 [Brevibacterium sp. Mu109]|nr:hypothetical protein BSP109_02648 [Brevibacterium sp. Mu109]
MPSLWRHKPLSQLNLQQTPWTERTYHRRRRQPRLSRLIPIEYETIMNPTAALAA